MTEPVELLTVREDPASPRPAGQMWLPSEVCERLGISDRALRRLMKLGLIGYLEIGPRTRRFAEEDIATLEARIAGKGLKKRLYGTGSLYYANRRWVAVFGPRHDQRFFIDRDRAHCEAWLARMVREADVFFHHPKLLAPRRTMSPKLRFTILERAGFRCHYCGRGADDGVKLVVDHIVAVANGGTNDEANLVAACWECNQGKADR